MRLAPAWEQPRALALRRARPWGQVQPGAGKRAVQTAMPQAHFRMARMQAWQAAQRAMPQQLLVQAEEVAVERA